MRKRLVRYFFQKVVKWCNYNSSKQNAENANVIYTALSSLIANIPDFMEYVQSIAGYLSFEVPTRQPQPSLIYAV